MVAVIVMLWNENSQLKKKVDACWSEIDIANTVIANANDDLQRVHDKAWSDYDTMGYALQDIDPSYGSVPNPCDKDYSGDLSNYPTQ
jgi:hypothetical protein